ncbi:hypothetical protein BH10BDE1_BH10BDE1_21010 [soil metagenome]
MRRLFSLFLVLLTCFAASTAPAREDFTEIFSAGSAEALKTVVLHSRARHRRARACEIQRRAGAPPTLCYPAKNSDVIDAECVRATRTAVRLPSSDEFTSQACRQAIEIRGKDLAYANEQDALR